MFEGMNVRTEPANKWPTIWTRRLVLTGDARDTRTHGNPASLLASMESSSWLSISTSTCFSFIKCGTTAVWLAEQVSFLASHVSSDSGTKIEAPLGLMPSVGIRSRILFYQKAIDCSQQEISARRLRLSGVLLPARRDCLVSSKLTTHSSKLAPLPLHKSVWSQPSVTSRPSRRIPSIPGHVEPAPLQELELCFALRSYWFDVDVVDIRVRVKNQRYRMATETSG